MNNSPSHFQHTDEIKKPKETQDLVSEHIIALTKHELNQLEASLSKDGQETEKTLWEAEQIRTDIAAHDIYLPPGKEYDNLATQRNYDLNIAMNHLATYIWAENLNTPKTRAALLHYMLTQEANDALQWNSYTSHSIDSHTADVYFQAQLHTKQQEKTKKSGTSNIFSGLKVILSDLFLQDNRLGKDLDGIFKEETLPKNEENLVQALLWNINMDLSKNIQQENNFTQTHIETAWDKDIMEDSWLPSLLHAQTEHFTKEKRSGKTGELSAIRPWVEAHLWPIIHSAGSLEDFAEKIKILDPNDTSIIWKIARTIIKFFSPRIPRDEVQWSIWNMFDDMWVMSLKSEVNYCLDEYAKLEESSQQKKQKRHLWLKKDLSATNIPLYENTKKEEGNDTLTYADVLEQSLDTARIYKAINNRYDQYDQYDPTWLATYATQKNISQDDTNNILIFNKEIDARTVNESLQKSTDSTTRQQKEALFRAFVTHTVTQNLSSQKSSVHESIKTQDDLAVFVFSTYSQWRKTYMTQVYKHENESSLRTVSKALKDISK